MVSGEYERAYEQIDAHQSKYGEWRKYEQAYEHQSKW